MAGRAPWSALEKCQSKGIISWREKNKEVNELTSLTSKTVKLNNIYVKR